jgi:hypothetical protein
MGHAEARSDLIDGPGHNGADSPEGHCLLI